MRDYFNTNAPMRFISPIDGDCLNIYDGVKKDGYLTIPVRVYASSNADIYINEKKAEYDGEYFVSEVPLKTYRTTIIADNHTDGTQTTIVVYKLENCIGKFRISVDDNILFLADLTKNQEVYTSLFDNPYLKVYKKAHDLYGAKVHINVYYEYMNEEGHRATFSSDRPYFNLTMMTDKFKKEWKDNSDWLKLSFHARANYPGNPYENTDYDRIDEDITLVHREILRFAGVDSLSPVTTLHWGAANETGVRVLRSRGYKGLNGYFTLNANGEASVSYCYPSSLVKHIGTRDFWVDNAENIVYSKTDLVLNRYKQEEIVPELERICADPHRAGFVELLIHEQYFYEDYSAYIPEYEEIILTASKYLTERGYSGALMSEVMFEKFRSNDIAEEV